MIGNPDDRFSHDMAHILFCMEMQTNESELLMLSRIFGFDRVCICKTPNRNELKAELD